MPASSTNIHDELPPAAFSRCTDCGYYLEGLPRHGRCPECGAEFDRADIVLLGRPAGPRGEWWWSRPMGAIALATGLYLGAVIWVMQFGVVMVTPIVIWSIITVLLLPAILKFIRRSSSPGVHECAVRMNARGVGIAQPPSSPTSINLAPWWRITILRLAPRRNNRLKIWIRCGDLDLLDVIVDCPHEHLNTLQELIARWRHR